MNEEPAKRAKNIISKILYITIATSTKDGKPWNSPVYSAFDQEYNFYWASDQNGQHSKNIQENEAVFIVIYDSTAPEGTGEGVFIQAKAHMLTIQTEIHEALKVLDERVGKTNNSNAKEFVGEYPRRVYKAIPEKCWINSEGSVNGNYIDIRKEVNLLTK
jgi:nitroimidazol reductase NimA-like FMN-containing flavoprotein (pyridoxamine 5'-phosphate oxidase superfamily)